MSIEYDFFRPRQAPASVLYDAFQAEALHRKERDVEEWIRLELGAVHRAACSYAAEHGVVSPSMEEVAAAKRIARGSVDYGAKKARIVAEKMVNLGR